MKFINRYIFLVFTITLISVGILSACNFSGTDKSNGSETEEVFTGTIKEINAYMATVNVEKGGRGVSRGSSVYVDLSVNSTETFQIGSKIKVEFKGPILLSNPAQINTIIVELVE